jgi:dUTPase
LDIFTPTNEVIPVGQTLKWSTGLRFQLPEGYHLVALQKSRHTGQLAVHAPLIDFAYRGEVHFCIQNLNDEPLYFHRGDAVMQLLPVFSPHMPMVWDDHQQFLDITERGAGGFGSTEQTR